MYFNECMTGFEWQAAAHMIWEGHDQPDLLEAGLAVAKPGNRCADIANALASTLAKRGLDRGGSRCGYPIGLSYPPDWGERTMSLRASDETILEPGMTFHFMPGLWLEDWGLETTESIVITETGAETLANYPRQLFVK